MSLEEPEESVKEKMQEELDESHINVEDEVERIMTWLTEQVHLPLITDKVWVYRFLYGCKFNEDRTKSVIEMYFRVRETVPELFANRNPESTCMEKNFQALYYFPLPTHTPQGYRVNIFKLRDTDPSLFNAAQFVRRLFMTADVRLQEESCLGDIMVFDFQGFTIGHLSKFTLSLARKFLVCAQDALPTRIRQMHFVNSPSFVDKIILLFKTFMKEKLAKRICVHTGDYSTLHAIIPRRILPAEYDGEGDSMEDLNEAWRLKLISYHSWFVQQENEVRQVARLKTKLSFGPEGTFRKLSID